MILTAPDTATFDLPDIIYGLLPWKSLLRYSQTAQIYAERWDLVECAPTSVCTGVWGGLRTELSHSADGRMDLLPAWLSNPWPQAGDQRLAQPQSIHSFNPPSFLHSFLPSSTEPHSVCLSVPRCCSFVSDGHSHTRTLRICPSNSPSNKTFILSFWKLKTKSPWFWQQGDKTCSCFY